ncbi:hypothetical protein VXQ18_13815 [Brucella abortus]|nr:hypothetical protein [Brucella abortus]
MAASLRPCRAPVRGPAATIAQCRGAAMPVRSRRITARLPISSTSSTEARWKN